MPKRRVKRHAVNQPLDKRYRLIPLTQGQNALVDAADFEWLSQWNWFAQWNAYTKSFYADRLDTKPCRRHRPMHCMILECGAEEMGDHINHNTLDNRRRNLRKATHSQNQHNQRKYANNSSGYKGVSWSKKTGKWEANIRLNGRRIFLGYFSDREEAASSYDAAAQKYHGEFAFTNFGPIFNLNSFIPS